MSINLFSNEQVQLLSQNPYTYSVNRYRLFLTKEFKEIFYSKHQSGELPRQILADYGYDPNVLGNRRVWGIASSIKKQYKKHGCFYDGDNPCQLTKASLLPSKAPVSEKEELKHLQHEVDYLKQEVEFLKKIFSTRTTRK